MKIISLAPSNTEILCELGMREHIIARTNQCDYPSEVSSIPSIGDWILQEENTVGFDFLDSLQPDVVITSMYLPDGLETACEQRNIELLHVNPQTVDGIYKSILQIGKCVSKQEAALQMVRDLSHRLQAISSEAKITARQPMRIYCEEWHVPPTVSANWVPELVEMVGGTTLGRPGVSSYEITSDVVMKFDPQVIIGHWCGFGDKTRLNVIIQRPGWQSIAAIQNKHVYSINDSLLNRPGPRIWQGAEAIHILLKKII